MDSTQLECFVSLARTLNFIKTADQLGLSQPAVSKQIKSLEKELGTTLFTRTSRSVSLTAVGKHFLREASAMLNIYYRTRQWIGAYYSEQCHVIRIGYSDPHALMLISNVLKKTISDFNGVISPELVLGQTDENLGRLQKDQLDFVVSMRDHSFCDNTIFFTKLQENGFKFIIAKDHPFAARFLQSHAPESTISSEDFWDLRQVLDIPPYLMKHVFSESFHIYPVNKAHANVLCSTVDEAYCLVLAGVGFALVPDHLALAHPDLLILEWKETLYNSFGIYHRKLENKNSPLYLFLKNAKSFRH